MKHKFLATVLLAAGAPLAIAQSSVSLYGIVDLGLSANSDGVNGTQYQLMNGVMNGSRFGIRGNEDLGGGLNVLFNLESAFSADTGVQSSYTPLGSSSAGTGFNRRSVVGLSHKDWGTLTLGRDYTAFFHASLATDPFALGLYGSNLNQVVLNGGPSENLHRASNGLFYTSPSMNGFTLRVVTSLGAERSTAPRDERRLWSIGGEYAAGKLLVAAAYQTDKILNATRNGTENRKDAILGAKYDFGSFALSGGYASVDAPGPDNKRSQVWLGGTLPVGNSGKVYAQVSEMKFDMPGGTPDGKGRTLGIAYTYDFSKLTTGYVSYGRVSNTENSRLTLYGAAASVAAGANGADPRGFAVGIRKRF